MGGVLTFFLKAYPTLNSADGVFISDGDKGIANALCKIFKSERWLLCSLRNCENVTPDRTAGLAVIHSVSQSQAAPVTQPVTPPVTQCQAFSQTSSTVLLDPNFVGMSDTKFESDSLRVAHTSTVTHMAHKHGLGAGCLQTWGSNGGVRPTANFVTADTGPMMTDTADS
jgi:hypothetical protein